ncbi:hypothetical protein RJ639_032373 [Escallonia herrerae]|uniref:DRBM domain-containing protein n=1 Tax=Escallonia herrerae TaxID=1293975 RepID=A0AA88WTW9_9ASTE|nr:hypothetical protein RJ639_032373 [Escallonia herrerae]
MYKNQLQELAQRSCFNLPSYTCVREGPDHAPMFKAAVNFNGETYESPAFCTTLRQAEHSAAEVALNALASRGPSNSLAARILDETGVYKNLLQEVSQRVGASLPLYTTYRSGLGHLPVFTCTVELAGITFTGEPAKNKKQAEKNAAMAAWSSLKLYLATTTGFINHRCSSEDRETRCLKCFSLYAVTQQSESSSEKVSNDEQEHVTVARALQKYRLRAKMSNIAFPIRFPMPRPRTSNAQPPPATTSKILPLICPKAATRRRPIVPTISNNPVCPRAAPQSRTITSVANDIPVCSRTGHQNQPIGTLLKDSLLQSSESPMVRPLKFPAAEAAPYIPFRHFRANCGIAPPVTIRNAIPVFSAPPLPAPSQPIQVRRPPNLGLAPPVCIRQAAPVYAAPSVQAKDRPAPLVQTMDALASKSSLAPPAPLVQAKDAQASNSSLTPPNSSQLQLTGDKGIAIPGKLPEASVVESVKELKI